MQVGMGEDNDSRVAYSNIQQPSISEHVYFNIFYREELRDRHCLCRHQNTGYGYCHSNKWCHSMVHILALTQKDWFTCQSSHLYPLDQDPLSVTFSGAPNTVSAQGKFVKLKNLQIKVWQHKIQMHHILFKCTRMPIRYKCVHCMCM